MSFHVGQESPVSIQSGFRSSDCRPENPESLEQTVCTSIPGQAVLILPVLPAAPCKLP